MPADGLVAGFGGILAPYLKWLTITLAAVTGDPARLRSAAHVWAVAAAQLDANRVRFENQARALNPAADGLAMSAGEAGWIGDAASAFRDRSGMSAAAMALVAQ
ncbi:MAG: hypothetical protein ACRCYU_20750, partial [Nocardioides sp.]